MKLHYIKQRNADGASLSNPVESLVLSVLPEETLLTEDMIWSVYNSAKLVKPKDFPSLPRTSVIENVRLLQDKGFLKGFSGYELRNALKLSR